MAAWNLGCGFAQNKTQLLVFRALAGLGGSAPLAVRFHLLTKVLGLTPFRLVAELSRIHGDLKNVAWLSHYTLLHHFWDLVSGLSLELGLLRNRRGDGCSGLPLSVTGWSNAWGSFSLKKVSCDAFDTAALVDLDQFSICSYIT